MTEATKVKADNAAQLLKARILGELVKAAQEQSFIPDVQVEQTLWVEDRTGWSIFVPEHDSSESEWVQYQQNKKNYLDYEERRVHVDTSGEYDEVIKCEKFKDGEKIGEENYK